MKKGMLFTLMAAIVLAACGNAQAPATQTPAAEATREPDRIGTRVAEELAIAATLTAAVPTPNPTATAAPTDTPTPSPAPTDTPTPSPAPTGTPQAVATASQIPATSTPRPVPTRRPRTATPKPTTAPQATTAPPPEAEVYAIIVAGGTLNGLEGSLVVPGQRGQIEGVVEFRDRINVRMRVWDPAVGGNDGDGIESVDFAITDDNGEVVFKRRETRQAYCLFGSDSVNCQSFNFAGSNYTWPQSDVPQQRMKNGRHRLQAVINKKRGGQGTWGFNFELKDIPSAGVDPALAQVVITIVDPPVNSVVTDRLVFQVRTYFTGSGSQDGDGIDKVKLEIIDAGGAVVYERTESNKPYCAFQDANNRCNVWVFAEHGNKWKNTAPIKSGTHTLRATSFSKTGASASTAIGIQIQLQ
jgi:hypothetical protein